MVLTIKKAVKTGAKLRLALYGPSGSGKTMTALLIARELAEGKRVAVIDTERKSASKYADTFDFDVLDLGDYHPNSYIEAIRYIEQLKAYDVLVLDSISHEWEGPRGALELAGRDFTNWAKVTPLHNSFVDAMLRTNLHVIATMRAKEEYVMVKEEGKKAEVRKVGIEPIQRKGIQYEFDIACCMEIDNTLIVEKSRCSALAGKTIVKPGKEIADILKEWLKGELAPEPQPTPVTAARPGEVRSAPAETESDAAVTEQQLSSIRKLCERLGKPEPETPASFAQAKELIASLTQEYRTRAAQPIQKAQPAKSAEAQTEPSPVADLRDGAAPTKEQLASIKNLCKLTNTELAGEPETFGAAKKMIATLSEVYKKTRDAAKKAS